MLLVIDGPEKAGKTTLISAIADNVPDTVVRKWGKLDDGRWAVDSTYADSILEDTRDPRRLVIWDRSWASEAVYGRLLGRDRRLAEDPWLGEWLYGRATPHKLMLLGPTPAQLAAARTEDDLPVETSAEQRAFLEYALQWNWRLLLPTKDGNRQPICDLLHTIVELVKADADFLLSARDGGLAAADPTVYAGPRNARVVFVGERRSDHESVPGGLLPFTSQYTTRFGRLLGRDAMQCGWTNAADDPAWIFERAELVIACGDAAKRWAERRGKEVGSSARVVSVRHPAAVYRWGKLSPFISGTEDRITSEVLPLVR